MISVTIILLRICDLFFNFQEKPTSHVSKNVKQYARKDCENDNLFDYTVK